MQMSMSGLYALLLLGLIQFVPSTKAASALQVKEGDKMLPSTLRGVVWGKTVMGAQAGVRIEGVKRQFALGEQVPLTLFLRNTTKHKLAVMYAAKMPLVWDSNGNAVPDTQERDMRTGRPGATLVILAPAETIWSQSPPVFVSAHFTSGLYRLGAGFLYGIFAQYRESLGDITRRKEFPGLAEAQQIMDQSDPRYQGHKKYFNMPRGTETVLTRSGHPYQALAVTMGADSVMTWSQMNAPTPSLTALDKATDFIWTQTEAFEVVAAH